MVKENKVTFLHLYIRISLNSHTHHSVCRRRHVLVQKASSYADTIHVYKFYMQICSGMHKYYQSLKLHLKHSFFFQMHAAIVL